MLKKLSSKKTKKMPYNQNIFSKGTITYLDIDCSFRPSPISDDIRLKTDTDAIRQQIKNVIFISSGEKPFQPEFDVGVYDLLFEPLDEITLDTLKDRIEIAIENYINRITLLNLEVKGDIDRNSINITIEFNMANVIEPQTIDIIVSRKR
jgi:phage baseplate assembly protein W